MNRISQYFRRKLSARISWWVLMSVTILFVAALCIMFKYSHDAIEKESLAKAQQMLICTKLSVENRLHRTEVATHNMLWNVEQHLDDPDVMVEYAMQMVENNPEIVGCAIAFEPNYYPEKGELYSTYAFRANSESDAILMTHDPTIIQPNEYKDVPYVSVNWYFIPKQENSTCWVRPHAPNDTINSTIVTCGMPIHDKQGNVVGVLASDISVADFSKTILNTKPFPSSYCALLGVYGNYIVHPDSSYLYHKMVREVVKSEPDKRVPAMVEDILGGGDSIMSVKLFGKDSYVLYKPINNKHWSVCLVCPEKEVFYTNKRLFVYMLVVMVMGVLLIFFFCLFFVSRQFTPLNMLARSVQRITAGEYNVAIPPTHRKDEIGTLQNNFCTMQTSLVRNIQQINQMSETLKSRNEELSDINAKVREAENMKMGLIHKIADKMILPIKEIEGVIANLEARRENLQKDDVQSMSEQIMTHTKAITGLLDQMLEIPKKKKQTS